MPDEKSKISAKKCTLRFNVLQYELAKGGSYEVDTTALDRTDRISEIVWCHEKSFTEKRLYLEDERDDTSDMKSCTQRQWTLVTVLTGAARLLLLSISGAKNAAADWSTPHVPKFRCIYKC